MWKKIEKGARCGRGARGTFAVYKSNAAHMAQIVIPEDSTLYAAERLDFYHDGGSRIAFAPAETTSGFKVGRGRAERVKRCYIPTQYIDSIPVGTTDAVVTVEDGMHVLDLSQFKPKAAG